MNRTRRARQARRVFSSSRVRPRCWFHASAPCSNLKIQTWWGKPALTFHLPSIQVNAQSLKGSSGMSDVTDKTTVITNYHLALKDAVIIEPTPRWVRAKFNGEFVADTKHALYVLEPRNQGAYYFPKRDVRTEFLSDTGHTNTSPALGTASILTLTVGAKVSEAAAWTYSNPLPAHAELSEYITFRWNKVDHWFEEEEEVFVHARNPYHRVDVAKSSRHVQIV